MVAVEELDDVLISNGLIDATGQLSFPHARQNLLHSDLFINVVVP